MKLNWGWRIAIVYSVFAVSTVGFVAFAMTENVELVRKDYYEHSLLHDKTNAWLTRARAVESDVRITIGESAISVRIPDAHAGASGIVTLYRPNSSRFDRSYKLEPQGIEIPLSELLHGHYTVVLEWTFANEQYRLERLIELGVAH